MTTPTAGDILLVRDYKPSGDLLGELIMAGERARFGDSDYSRWTHSALIVNSSGDLIEALADGIKRTNLSKYQGVEVLVVSPPVNAAMRAYACAFAQAQVGTEYDVLDFVFLALSLLTGAKLSLHSDRAFICSGLVSRATECYTAHGYDYPTEQIMPADIGQVFGALSGEPLPPLSFVGRLLDKFRALVRAIL